MQHLLCLVSSGFRDKSITVYATSSELEALRKICHSLLSIFIVCAASRYGNVTLLAILYAWVLALAKRDTGHHQSCYQLD